MAQSGKIAEKHNLVKISPRIMAPRLTVQEKLYTLNSHTLLHKLYDSMFLCILVFLDSDWWLPNDAGYWDVILASFTWIEKVSKSLTTTSPYLRLRIGFRIIVPLIIVPILDNGDVHCCQKVKISLDYVKFFLDYDAIYMNASSTEKLLLTPP